MHNRIHLVKLLDKNKFTFPTKTEWRTIEIKNKLTSKYVNISPYYMNDTDEYDKIEDVEFLEVFNTLKPELLKIYKTEKIAKMKLEKLIWEEF
jgi:hypothetical protein